MVNKEDIEKYHLRKKDIEKYHKRIFFELHPSGMDNPHPGKNKYKPTGVISRRDWEGIKKSYRLLFAPLHIKIEVIEKYLDEFYRNWKDGVYPNSEKFLETLDGIFREFADFLQTKNQKFYTDIQTYDNLLEKFHEITNQLAWDDSVIDNLLKDKAIEKESHIHTYFKKRIDHGLEIIDEMKEFKGVEKLLKEQFPFEERLKKYVKEVKWKDEPEPPTPPVRTDYEGDYESNWECALDIRKKIVTGDGFPTDMQIYKGYDWAVENCTVKGKPIEHRNKLINGYDNAKRKTKSAVIIGKFEEGYYDD